MYSNAFNIGYLLEIIPPILGICLGIEKKNNGLLKAIICVIIGFLVDTGMTMFLLMLGFEGDTITDVTMSTYIYVLVWFISVWLAVIFGIFFSCKVTLHEAVYLFAISYAIEHIFYCIRMLAAYIFNISDDQIVLYVSCLIGSFVMAYFWFAKPIVKGGQLRIETIVATSATIIILFVVWLLSIVASFNNITHIHAVYAIVACLFILFNQREQLINENERLVFQQKERLWKETQVRYQLSKDAMAVVNQHYHDMKHQINVLANMENDEKRRGILAEMENDIAIYDAVVRTGNELLDTVLTEKKLVCHSKNINMSCMADGKQLDFMDDLDIYTLLGNALDNAIEANEKILNKDKRWISVQIQNKKGIVLVEIVNPYDGNIEMSQGLPVTSKEDKLSHGFGTASIKNIVEKYNGQMNIKTDSGKYLLRMIFTE